MKFLIVSFALAAVVAGQQYQSPVYKEPLAGAYKTAAILRQTAEQNPDGSYDFSYETENGIAAAEKGVLTASGPKGEPAIEAQGGFQYTAPDGTPIAVKYTAGPQGFVAEGAHLPVAPPIPELILRSLAYNAAHPPKEGSEYYKPELVKPIYYPQPVPSQKPIFEPEYTTPKPIYTLKPYYKPTYQPTYQPYPQNPFSYTPSPL